MYKKIIADYLKSKIQNLRAVIIFGSFANNSENKYSDIDIAFLSSEKISNIKRWEFQEELASILNRDVDLVDLENASDVFKFQIASQGIVIYADNSKNIELYLDKIYTIYLQLNDDRKAILEDIRNGVYYV
ncbi:MAG: type VII toxin-antitoxin system MntA family adenylyltransferase antitoxin [bacterium]